MYSHTMVDLKFALWYAVRPEHSRVVELKHLCSYTVFGLTAYSKKVESLKQQRLAHVSIVLAGSVSRW